MKYGINLLLWTGDDTEERMHPVYDSLAAMGYDGVELTIFSGEPDAYETLGRRLDALGLERTGCVIRNPQDDPISPDPAVRRKAVDAMKHAFDCAQAAGVSLVGGPFYAAIGQFSGAPPTGDEWKWSRDVLAEVAADAKARGITLAMEFLNRFEIYLLNTAADTHRMALETGADNLGVHYDTFHAHIEEKDAPAAIAACGDRLLHFHVSENDRSTPGRGQVRWAETFDALAASGYDGWLTVEAFGGAIPELVAATKIWRRMFESEEQLARDGLAFMKREWQAREAQARGPKSRKLEARHHTAARGARS
jgi:D-psicose/D-tagatose/L-ribulose 3-epimerase